MEHQPLVTRPPVTGAPPLIGWRKALPTIVGERSLIRELDPSDAPGLAPLLAAPEVARFISPPPADVEDFERFVARSRHDRQAGRCAVFGIVAAGDDCAAGLLQIRQLDPLFHTAEWGFGLGSRFWGSGLFLDAARLLLDFAFHTIRVRRLEARVAVPNARGHAVMRKLGAVQEGVLRRSLVTAGGRQLDQVLWSLLADEWQSDAHLATRVH
jgi:[ribosomal protein S5]-alanine N-acetyltransferase